MELVFTSKKDYENRVIEVSSVGLDLQNQKIYVWGDENERAILDTDQTDFVLVMPGLEGGEEND